MTSCSQLTRLYGERMGRLSGQGQLEMLCEELRVLAPVLGSAATQSAFRESFFGAGGKQKHWDMHVAAIVQVSASEPESAPTPTGDAAGSDEDALWQQITAKLGEADGWGPDERMESEADAAMDGLLQGEAETVEAAEDCRLRKWEIGEDILVVRVEGSLGAGEHGGSRLLEEVAGAVAAGVSRVVLDLSAVSTLRLDSPAAVVTCQMKAEGVSGRFALVRPSGAAAAALLEATGVTRAIECFDDVRSALEYVVQGMEPGQGG